MTRKTQLEKIMYFSIKRRRKKSVLKKLRIESIFIIRIVGQRFAWKSVFTQIKIECHYCFEHGKIGTSTYTKQKNSQQMYDAQIIRRRKNKWKILWLHVFHHNCMSSDGKSERDWNRGSLLTRASNRGDNKTICVS